MPGEPIKLLIFRPAAIAVHDDRNMAWNIWHSGANDR
jgi:hypothetical protein